MRGVRGNLKYNDRSQKQIKSYKIIKAKTESGTALVGCTKNINITTQKQHVDDSNNELIVSDEIIERQHSCLCAFL